MSRPPSISVYNKISDASRELREAPKITQRRLAASTLSRLIGDTNIRSKLAEESYNIAKALNYPFKEKTNSVGVSGCGMNMAFHVISQVATSLFGDYKKLKYEAL